MLLVICPWLCYNRQLNEAPSIRKTLCDPAIPYDARVGRPCWCSTNGALLRVPRTPLLVFWAYRPAGPGRVFLLVDRKCLLLIATIIDSGIFHDRYLPGGSRGCLRLQLLCVTSPDTSTLWWMIRALFH